jgi:hypothetical protein
MDHNMVLSYDYTKQKRRRQQTNAPPLQAMLMAMRRHWSNSCGIAWWRMSRAISEVTRRHHRATTCSVLLPRTPGRQSTTQRWINTPTLRVVSMAIAMRRYDTARITQWRGSWASLEATGCHHRASTHSDSHQSDMPTPVFLMFFIVKLSKRPQNHKDSP